LHIQISALGAQDLSEQTNEFYHNWSHKVAEQKKNLALHKTEPTREMTLFIFDFLI